MGGLRERWRGFTDLLLQAQCPLCDRTAVTAFCQYCQRQVQQCQLADANWAHHEHLPILAWGRYGGALRQAIAAFKYNNHPELAQPFAHWLAHTWLNASARAALTALTVVPIPMHPSKRQQRGFNQAELLATHFCTQTRLRYQPHGLERSRETAAQFQLTARDREQNLAHAFSLGDAFRRQPPPGSVLLLDDIYTTGATARAAAQTLRRHGIRVHGVVVLARAEWEQGQSTGYRGQGAAKRPGQEAG